MAIKESFQKVIDHFKLEELSDEQNELLERVPAILKEILPEFTDEQREYILIGVFITIHIDVLFPEGL